MAETAAHLVDRIIKTPIKSVPRTDERPDHSRDRDCACLTPDRFSRIFALAEKGGLKFLFSETQPSGRGGDPTLGWEGVTGEVEVVRIPGDQDVIVEAPELARRLREAVEDALGRVCVSTRLGKNVMSVPIDTATVMERLVCTVCLC